MRTRSPLLPLFRSDTQARILAETFLVPQRSHTIQSLADLAAVPYATAHREISSLVASGLLTEQRVGQARVVQANVASPFFHGVELLVQASFGVVPMLRESLSAVPGIGEAWLFGSFAARLLGAVGAQPNDVDVLVVGRPELDAVYEVCAGVGAKVGREVNPTFVSEADWSAAVDPFVQQLLSQPLVAVIEGAAEP